MEIESSRAEARLTRMREKKPIGVLQSMTRFSLEKGFRHHCSELVLELLLRTKT